MAWWRWTAAIAMALLSGVGAYACLIMGIFDGWIGRTPLLPREVWWFFAAPGALVLGGAAWVGLLPRAKRWGLVAVPGSALLVFLTFGGPSIFLEGLFD
ncbi:hypothetical protein CLV92_1185 [Kineococcus xinjiangensis]|uniref:Uncharacterized protein n=1 Tax=Kineococcus xinjiangensis TaxID=512762 RepID=A0A2S6ICN4_9ACTN|nr:hypothetical protein [Kineococcus xinjiangensis]PPK91966.1 hypothetical protein CLV92_1185 [Kineococcus xinjiangensis]